MTGNADLTLEAFTILRKHFFDQKGTPKPFPLRHWMSTSAMCYEITYRIANVCPLLAR
jgi:hypothetical protein